MLRQSGRLEVISKSMTASSAVDAPPAARPTPPRSRPCGGRARASPAAPARPPARAATRRGSSQGELLQEAEVVFVEQRGCRRRRASAAPAARCRCRRRSRYTRSRVDSRPPRRPRGGPCRSRAPRSSRCACTSSSRPRCSDWQPMKTSALGSVYGKKLGWNIDRRLRVEQLAQEADAACPSGRPSSRSRRRPGLRPAGTSACASGRGCRGGRHVPAR